jgi:flagellar biosynthesis/type III secretory pathway protein FliH
MKKFSLKKIALISGLGVAALAATSTDANAQGSRRYDDRHDRRIEKQREKIERQQEKLREQREKLARERREDRYNNNGYYNNGTYNNNNRYRVYRNGRYYNTDNRGAELLRQAVNSGYQQGYQAGQYDRNNRRRSSWTTSNIYRSGTYGYQSYVDRNQYQYYFQQGFQRGYQDGYNSQYRYGNNSGNGLNILGNILSSILNIQQY